MQFMSSVPANSNDYIVIPLTRGKFALISPEDGELAAFKWLANAHHTGKHYARRYKREGGRRLVFALHRVIAERMGLDISGKQVDHINGDTLDCRRNNLRAATSSENVRNRGMFKNNKTGLKGVSRAGERFCAVIQVNKKQTWLGTFDTPQEAHAAYCDAAKKHHLEFARVA